MRGSPSACRASAIAEAATQQAVAYARERKQGRTPGMPANQAAPIIVQPDVKRMLLTMRALTNAARAICYATAVALDRSHRAADAAARQAAHERASLLTPIAKAFATDVGSEVASLGIQVHGGMGYIEETGAAQLYRDARIAQIYEGTNGIQAIDLVTRKLPLSGGAAVRAYLAELWRTVAEVEASNDPAFGATGTALRAAVDAFGKTTEWLLERIEREPQTRARGRHALSAPVRDRRRRLPAGAGRARRKARRQSARTRSRRRGSLRPTSPPRRPVSPPP